MILLCELVVEPSGAITSDGFPRSSLKRRLVAYVAACFRIWWYMAQQDPELPLLCKHPMLIVAYSERLATIEIPSPSPQTTLRCNAHRSSFPACHVHIYLGDTVRPCLLESST